MPKKASMKLKLPQQPGSSRNTLAQTGGFWVLRKTYGELRVFPVKALMKTIAQLMVGVAGKRALGPKADLWVLGCGLVKANWKL